MKPILAVCLLFCFVADNQAQESALRKEPKACDWIVTHHESAASFRGVHIHDRGTSIWVSGSKGTVLHSVDLGKSWQDVSPEGAGEFDFRDIHGFDGGEHAVALAVGSPARIYRASEYGETWQVVYEDTRPEIFLDALAFWDNQNGIAFGDPIDGRLVILRTSDGGKSWAELESDKQPVTLEGEGGFAASGTCLCIQGAKVFIGLGGDRKQGDPVNARILMSADRGGSWKVIKTPMKSGTASGVFSITFTDDLHGVAVGGTYDDPDDKTNNICITEDGGMTWFRPKSTTRGYRSCVAVTDLVNVFSLQFKGAIAVGKTGTDYSSDHGKTWIPWNNQAFYAVGSSELGHTVIAVGPEGRIGVLPDNGANSD